MLDAFDINLINSFLSSPLAQVIFLLLAVWSLAWKGIALWKSSHNNQKNWFIVMLVINTFGILEIIYIFYFQAREGKKEVAENNKNTNPPADL